MNIRTLICTALTALLFLVSAPASNAEEMIVFESALKDAVFVPLYIGAGSAVLDRQMERDFPFAGWWTLKFENGAIVTYYRSPGTSFELIQMYKKAGIKGPGSGVDIWWIGKVYIVSINEDRPDYFSVKLKEEPEADLDQILTKRSGPAGLQGLSARMRDSVLSGKTAKSGGARQGTDGTNGPYIQAWNVLIISVLSLSPWSS